MYIYYEPNMPFALFTLSNEHTCWTDFIDLDSHHIKTYLLSSFLVLTKIMWETEIITSPGKKQQCFLSICLPKVICNRLNLIWSVSMISLSQAKGWLLRADSRLGILDLMNWNLCNIWFCRRWNVEFKALLHIVFSWRFTCWCNK